ncbi:MAG: GlsB/YeaQ/YmgE family stress response membrane protein [Desulfitobacteriia bacterium]
MGIISWIILGGIAGWIASKFTGNDARMGIGMNILVGIIGAFLGGWIVSLFGVTGVSGFNIWSLLVAVIGAVVLLLLINAVMGNKRHGSPNV